MDLALGPDEWLGILVIAGDVGLELFDGLEGCAGERLAAEDREPYLDLVEPRAMGRRVVEMHVAVARQPEVTLRFVGRGLSRITWSSRSG